MRILTFTSLYPSESRPRHGTFVEARLVAMRQTTGITATVVAPVPWFPFSHARFGAYARLARTSRQELRSGIEVFHPRYPTLPWAGMYLQPLSMALGALGELRRQMRSGGDFDVIDAHYIYPDGVAAALLAGWLSKPLVITARGSDVNLLARLAWPRRLITWAASKADRLVTVSAALAERLADLGVDRGKITVIRNGVDLERFAPVDRNAARRRLGLSVPGAVVASVGNLVSEKGHDLVIDAVARLPGVQLLIVGDGPAQFQLRDRIAQRHMEQRAILLPSVPQDELRWIYGAADAIVLGSSREGLPNVLLEALACGVPVIASRVGGVPEIVTDPVMGRLVASRTPEGFASMIAEVLSAPPAGEAVRRLVQGFDWAVTARAHTEVLERAVCSVPRNVAIQRKVS